MSTYRGHELDRRSAAGGVNISKDGEFVAWTMGSVADAKAAVDDLTRDIDCDYCTPMSHPPECHSKDGAHYRCVHHRKA